MTFEVLTETGRFLDRWLDHLELSPRVPGETDDAVRVRILARLRPPAPPMKLWGRQLVGENEPGIEDHATGLRMETDEALRARLITETTTEALRPLWERWCREAAEAEGITYEQLVARLAAGEAALQIKVVLPSDSGPT